MLYPRITKLYMYKPPDAYTLDILINGRLWASKPERFNDPFDCDLEYVKGFTEKDYLAATCRKYGKSDQWPSEIVQYVSETIDADGNFTPEGRDRVNKAIQEGFIQKNKNSGVICLSEVCDSILMWSHYTKKHTGVCVEFTRAEDNDLGDEEICSPVRYERHYPQIDLGWLTHQDGRVMQAMMWTKSWEWAYEQEWRLITDCGGRECPLPGPISRVILGVKIEDWFKSCIETLCKNRNIPCVQARKANREFRIEMPLDRKRR